MYAGLFTQVHRLQLWTKKKQILVFSCTSSASVIVHWTVTAFWSLPETWWPTSTTVQASWLPDCRLTSYALHTAVWAIWLLICMTVTVLDLDDFPITDLSSWRLYCYIEFDTADRQ